MQVRIFENFVAINYRFSLKTSKFNKSAGWNKGLQVEKFLKFDKVCCTIIWETKVREHAELKFEIVN